jgi:O-antigen/teichoic acid export membrane protein
MTDNFLILKNSAILYIRLLVTSVIGLFTSRFIIQSLGASDFGLYTVVGGIVIIMAFVNNAMTSTTFRYIAFELGKGDIAGVKKIFNISLVIHICLALIIVLFAETLGEFYIRNYLNVLPNKIPDALFVFRFSVLSIFFSVLSIPFQSLITAKERFSVIAIIEVVRSVLSLSVAIILIYYLGNRLRIYASLTAIVLLIPPLFYSIYCIKKYKEIIQWNFQPDKNKYLEIIGFSGWIIVGAGASVGKVQGAALLINSFFGTILNASFGIANQINSIIVLFSQNLGQAAIPQITMSFSKGNTDRTINLVSYISKYTFFLMLLPSLPILLELEFLLKLWLGNVPIFTVPFCQLMIINALIDSLGSGIPAAIQATGKIKYFQLILSTTSILCIPVSYILLKFEYPPTIILITFTIVALINVIICQILLKKLINFNVKYFLQISYLKILYVLLFISPLFLIRIFFDDNLKRFFILSTMSIFWLLIGVYHVGLENKEKNKIKELIRPYSLF